MLVGRHDQRHRLLAAGRVLGVVAEDGVIGRQDRAARVAENRVDAFVGEHLDEDIRAGHTRAGQRVAGFQRRFRRGVRLRGHRAAEALT
jgi:hypothetical protein